MAKIIVDGNLGKDPVMKQSVNGEFATCTVADHVNKDTTDWYNLIFNNPRDLNRIKKETFKKGSRVFIIGTQRIREYEYNGEKRVSHDIFVDSCDLNGGSGMPSSGATETVKEEITKEEDSQNMIAAAMASSNAAINTSEQEPELPF